MNARRFLTSCVLLVANIQDGHLLMAGASAEKTLTVPNKLYDRRTRTSERSYDFHGWRM